MTFAAHLPFSIIVLAVLLWLLLWGCKKLLFRWLKGKKSHKKSTFYFPIVQYAAWVLFAGYGIFRFTQLNPLVTLIVVSALLFLSRKFWQNFLSGLFFRLEKRDLRGTSIVVEGEEGVLVAYGLTTACLKSNNGSWLYIPYEKLYQESYVRTVKTAHAEDMQMLQVFFEKEAVLSQDLLEAIRRKVLLNPYVAAGENVRITVGKDATRQWIVLDYTLLNPERAEDVKQKLEETIAGLKAS